MNYYPMYDCTSPSVIVWLTYIPVRLYIHRTICKLLIIYEVETHQNKLNVCCGTRVQYLGTIFL